MRLIIIIYILILLSSCGIFKTRSVSIAKKDSTITSVSTSNLIKQASHKDTSSKKVITISSSTDSTTTETKITPIQGIPFVFNNGVFNGQATSVDVISKKKDKTQSSSTTTQKNAIQDSTSSDSSGSSSKKVAVSTYNKSVVSKPDYKWIIYVVGILLVLGGIAYEVIKGKIKNPL